MRQDARAMAACFVAGLVMLALALPAWDPAAASQGPVRQARGGRPMPEAGGPVPESDVERAPSVIEMSADRPRGEATTSEGHLQDVTVRLRERHNSGVSGMATLTMSGDRTVVSVTLKGTKTTHPVHIHRGTCQRLDPMPAYPLTDVVPNRASTTTIGAPLQVLLSGEYAVNVHQPARDLESLQDPRNYAACGEITSIEGPRPTVTPMVALPTSGTGAGEVRNSGQRLVWSQLGMLIMALASGGMLARQRGTRL